MGVTIQPDGRIIAVGRDGTMNLNNCAEFNHLNRFVVTRWTANGQLETTRYLDNITGHVGGRNEGAFAAPITKDGSKVLVFGTYKDLRPNSNPIYPQTISLIRLNLSDLSLDTTFGIKQFNGCAGGNCGLGDGAFRVKAIQPDGKILGIDAQNRVIRSNSDGSADQSFGNVDATGVPPFRGALLPQNILVYSGFFNPLGVGHIIVRPNGRINLIGAVLATSASSRAAVSQQNTVFENGNYSDFTNDGRTDVGVFRPSTGAWFYLNSANNQSNGISFGQAGDKPAPADYDGDGKTDFAVFRDGIWYLLQSTKGFAGISFGTTDDLPRPGDFDGDGKADIAVFRPSNGVWYRLNSSTGGAFLAQGFGQSGDRPTPGDYDNDGKHDLVVYRSGIWYMLRSGDNSFSGVAYGAPTDTPVPAAYLP